MTRTWKERGEWMDKHHGYVCRDALSSGVILAYDRPNRDRHETGGCDAAAAIDAAMDECERIEKETAERNPTAGIMARAMSPDVGIPAIRAAIKAQADLWRKDAKRVAESVQHDSPAYYRFQQAFARAETFTQCADELEGK